MSKSKAVFHPPQGYVHPDFEPVLEVFRQNHLKEFDKGGSFAVYYKGQLVVSIWGGSADEKVKRPWEEDTLGHFHSCTKFMAAVCIARLVERGLLDYEEKVSKYWPEFAQNGKKDITLSTLLSHKAGLAALDKNFDLGMMRDKPHQLRALLSQQKPLWEPGRFHGYSPIVSGLYLSEIVRRIDPKGRSVSDYFREEIAGPFGIDFHIGLPSPLQSRAARLEPQGNPKERALQRMESFQGDPDVLLLATQQPKDWNSRWKLNDPHFAALPCPSSHGIGTARAAAKFAGIIANGGNFEDKTLLSQKSIQKLQTPLSIGTEITFSDYCIYGLGTMLHPVRAGRQKWFMFGHSGFGGQNLVVDTKLKIGWAYVTNYVDPFSTFEHNKWKPLVHALYECVFKLENISEKFEMLESYEEHLKSENMINKL